MKKNYRFKLCWRYLVSAVVLMFCCSLFNNSYAQSITVDGDPSDWGTYLNSPPSTFKATSFVVDEKNAKGEDDQFTGGTKDFSHASDMKWSMSQVNDKNELTNAAVIIEEHGGQRCMFFFSDRVSTNGSAEIGFWVFQGGTAPRSPEMDFYPEKQVGDLLILATFTEGGRVPNLEIWRYKYPDEKGEARFEWQPYDNDQEACAYVSDPSRSDPGTTAPLGTLDPVTGEYYYDVPTFNPSYADHPGWDWTYCNKEENDCGRYYDGSFFEGGLNLTLLGLADIKLCGGTFLMETRESHSLTSAVNDFIAGSLNYVFEITAIGDKVCEDPKGEPVEVNLCALTKEGTPDFADGTTFKWYAEDPGVNESAEAIPEETSRCYTPSVTETTSFWVIGTDPDDCVSAPVEAVAIVEPRPVLTPDDLTECENEAGKGIGTFDLTKADLGLDETTMDVTYSVEGSPITSGLDAYDASDGTVVDVEADFKENTLDCPSTTTITLHVNYMPVLTPVDNDLCASKTETTTDIEICVTGTKAGEIISWYDNSDLTGEPIQHTLTESLKDCLTLSLPSSGDEVHMWVTSTSEDDCVSEPVEVVAIVHPNPVCEITNPTNTDCDASNGTALVAVSGGTPPYTVKYLAKEIPGQYPADLPLLMTDLPKGLTTVTVIDANDCETTCDVTIEENPCPTCCWMTSGGYLNCEMRSGKKDNTFGGNVGPPPSGSWEQVVRDHKTGEILYNFHSHDANAINCFEEPPGPCHPDGPVNAIKFGGTGFYSEGTGSREYPAYFEATVIDHNEPGRVGDKPAGCNEYADWYSFTIWTDETKETEVFHVDGFLDGGNLQIHPCKDKEKSAEILHQDASALIAYPNPFSDKVTFEFVSGVDAYGVLDIFNVTGQKVARILDRPVKAGVMNRIEYGPESKVSGMYFYRLDLDGKLQTGSVIYKEE